MEDDLKGTKVVRSKYSENQPCKGVQEFFDNRGIKSFTKIEECYDYIGPLGRAQICYLVVLSLLNLLSAYNFLMAVFLLVVPEWECKAGKVCVEDMCKMPRENWDWVRSDRTMVSYFELQCDSSYAILASSLFFVPGTVVGLAVSGYLSDKYGRKKTLLSSIILSLILAIGQTFSSSYPLFLTLRTLSGVTSVAYMSIHITYRDEFFPSTKRPVCYFLGLLFKTAGLLLLAGVYEMFTSWRALNGASAILLAVPLLAIFVPESPHWLLTNSTTQDTTDVLLKMARFNLGPDHGLREEHFQLKKVSEGGESGDVMMIIRNRAFLITTLKFFFHWFVTSLLYYGFYYALDALSGSVSINFMIMGALELPMAAATAVMMDKIGRRKTLFVNLLLVMICCGLSLLKVSLVGAWTVKRVASIVGSKWGVAAMFMIVYMYTNEVMPTSIRSTGLHMCSICARIGAFIAPYLVKACNDSSYYLLNSLCVLLCGVAILLTLGLPETKDKTLRANLNDEDEVFRDDEKL